MRDGTFPGLGEAGIQPKINPRSSTWGHSSVPKGGNRGVVWKGRMGSVFPGKREPWDWCPDPVQEQKSGEKNGFRSSGTHLDSDPPHKGFSFGHPHPQLPARPFSLGILHRFPTFLHLWVTRRDGIPGGAAGSAQDYPNNPTGASPTTPKPCSGISGITKPFPPSHPAGIPARG